MPDDLAPPPGAPPTGDPARPWLADYPPGVGAVAPPLPHATASALLLAALATHAGRTHSRFLGHALSYAQIDHASRALAAYLQAQGLLPGDRLAIMLPNTPQYAIAVFAALRAGLVIVNVNPHYTPRELSRLLADAQPAGMVVLEAAAHRLADVVPRLALRVLLVTALTDQLPWHGRLETRLRPLSWRRPVAPGGLPGSVRWRRALRAGRGLPLREHPAEAADLAVLQYTGGTTGAPKGAMLTQANLLAALTIVQHWLCPLLRPDPQEAVTVLLALPMYHVYGFVSCLLFATSIGGGLVLVPDPRDTRALVATWARQPVHLFAGINALYAALLDAPGVDAIDFSSLRYSGAGGAATQARVAERWQALTGRRICEGFGMSETTSACCSNPWHHPAFTATAGVPLPGMDVSVRDADGRPQLAGARGELCVRGPLVTAGYWRNPAATAEAFTPDGFLRTGDIAELTGLGHVRIVDRRKDMILVSGFNVYPNEVEEVLAAHPDVRECAVVGLPDDAAGEQVCAVVVARDGIDLDLDALRTWCASQLTPYKRPRRYVMQQALPKSPVGKILRREVREALRPKQVN